MESPSFLRIHHKCHNILRTILRRALKATINFKEQENYVLKRPILCCASVVQYNHFHAYDVKAKCKNKGYVNKIAAKYLIGCGSVVNRRKNMSMFVFLFQVARVQTSQLRYLVFFFPFSFLFFLSFFLSFFVSVWLLYLLSVTSFLCNRFLYRPIITLACAWILANLGLWLCFQWPVKKFKKDSASLLRPCFLSKRLKNNNNNNSRIFQRPVSPLAIGEIL